MSQTADPNDDIHMLEVFHPLREALLREAIAILQIPAGSRGLDAGCGIGLPAMMLAETMGPDGHVTGLDVSPEFLAYAGRTAKKAGLAELMSFQEGDIHHLPFEDQTFDWVWSMDCAGYRAEDPLPLFQELTRVIKPGGMLALSFYSSDRLLPGYPLLEARFNATTSGIAPFTSQMKPETHYLRTLRWMQAVNLHATTGRTLIGNLQAPLNDAQRQALLALFQMRWEKAKFEVTDADWVAYERLCHSESTECIVNLPDYYAFFTYSIFYGHKEKQ